MMKGQSLVEAILAISVIGVIISGISVVIVASLNNANFGKTQTQATQYAQEGIETLRLIRNNNYSGFQSYNGNYCLNKYATTLTSPDTCVSPNLDKYKRSVSIEQSPGCATNITKVTVSVSWTDGKCAGGDFCHKSNLVSCMSRINPIQSP